MNARVNQAVIEGLATMGLGHKVPFLWEPCPFDAVNCAYCVESECLKFPQLDDESTESRLNAGIGLALLGVQAHGRTEFGIWPEAGLRREVLAALELGIASFEVTRKMQHATEKLIAMHDCLVSQFEPANAESVRFLAVVLISSLQIGLGINAHSFWNSVPEGEQAVDAFLRDHLKVDATTADLVDLVTRLVPETSPAAKPEDDGTASAKPESGAHESAEAPIQDSSAQGAFGSETEAPKGEEQGTGIDSANSATNSSNSNPDPSVDVQTSVLTEVLNAGAEESVPEGSDDEAAQRSAKVVTTSGIEGEAVGQATSIDQHEGVELLNFISGMEGGDGFASESSAGSPATLSGCDGRLVNALLVALQTRRKRNTGYVNSGPRVAAHRLWRLRANGDTAVFRKRAEREGTNIAVQILLDRSSSMDHGDRFEVARDVTMALATALNRMMGVTSAVDVFPGTGAAAKSILPFGGMLNKARDEMACIQPEGGTPLAGALDLVRPLLLRQSRLRKVIIIITDGRPGNPRMAQTEIDICREMGIEVYAIGIGIDVSALIPNSTKVDDVQALPTAVTSLFENMLEPVAG